MGKIKRAVLENFKTIEKLSLLKKNLKSFFFSLYENSLFLVNRYIICFLLSLSNRKWRIGFLFYLKIKERIKLKFI